MNQVTHSYFTAGGTLKLDAPSYVKRPADELLLQQVLANQLCYVLTTRQMGKSSLMIRTAEQLQQAGISPAIVDLSEMGTQGITSAQWYLGILTTLASQLHLALDVQAWWTAQGKSGVVQRFSDFMRQVVLSSQHARIVIFFDEIDSTLSLDFTDDFFAAVRSMYNERAMDPAYERLTFVLLGVASPASLIKDANRTPFNVGQGIDLAEFSREDALPLEQGLACVAPGQGGPLLDRIFYWTHGHPYLTQKICRAVAEAYQPGAVAAADGARAINAVVDRCVTTLFLDKDARGEENLQFVRSRVAAYPEPRPLLRLYQRIYSGAAVSDDERSLLQNELKLIGLITARQQLLQVRNEIYRRVFNLAWIKQNTPINWANLVTISAIGVTVVTVFAVIVYQRWQTQRQIALLSDGFRTNGNPNVKMINLADVCELDQGAGQTLFTELPGSEQIALFQQSAVKVVGQKLLDVVACVKPKLPQPPPAALVDAMCSTLQKRCQLYNLPAQSGNLDTCGCQEGKP